MLRLVGLATALLVGAGCGDDSVDGPDFDAAEATDAAVVIDAAPVVGYQWIESDTHIHSHGCSGTAQPADLVAELVDQGLQVGNALIWGAGLFEDIDFFTGDDDPASLPGAILHYDLEVSAFAASWLGHLNVQGLHDIRFSLVPYESPISGLPIIEWALEQGPRVVIGMNHGQVWAADDSFPMMTCCTPFEFPVHVARGTMSFLEIENSPPGPQVLPAGTIKLWNAVQNSGYRVALTGASDFPCIFNQIGAMRTRVLVNGDLTFESYLDGLREGRTVLMVGNQDWVDFNVDGARIGDEVEAAGDQQLSIELEALLREAGVVELLVNGEVAQTFDAVPGEQSFATTLTLSDSAWLAARTARAHTSSIYVVVDGMPIRPSTEAPCYLAGHVQSLIDLVEIGGMGDYSAFIPIYEQARDDFLARAAEAGEPNCPP